MTVTKAKIPDRPDMVEILRGGAKEGQVVWSCIPVARLNDFASGAYARGPAGLLQPRAEIWIASMDLFDRSASLMHTTTAP